MKGDWFVNVYRVSFDLVTEMTRERFRDCDQPVHEELIVALTPGGALEIAESIKDSLRNGSAHKCLEPAQVTLVHRDVRLRSGAR